MLAVEIRRRERPCSLVPNLWVLRFSRFSPKEVRSSPLDAFNFILNLVVG
jgi:hypothetical protein